MHAHLPDQPKPQGLNYFIPEQERKNGIVKLLLLWQDQDMLFYFLCISSGDSEEDKTKLEQKGF